MQWWASNTTTNGDQRWVAIRGAVQMMVSVMKNEEVGRRHRQETVEDSRAPFMYPERPSSRFGNSLPPGQIQVHVRPNENIKSANDARTIDTSNIHTKQEVYMYSGCIGYQGISLEIDENESKLLSQSFLIRDANPL